MKNRRIFLFAMIAALMTLPSVNLFADDDNDDQGDSDKLKAEIFWAKGHDRKAHTGATNSSPNLSWHGGSIMSSVVVTPIFWGPNWGNANFTNDKMTGLQTFYMGIGNSTYAHTSDEYGDANGLV